MVLLVQAWPIRLGGLFACAARYITVQTYTLDYYNLFLILLLYYAKLILLLRTCNNYFRENLAYYKLSFVKVIDIFLKDSIFVDCISYKLKLHVIHVKIFA